MSEYQPGTVAVATVRGVEGVRVIKSHHPDDRDYQWWTADQRAIRYDMPWLKGSDVADVCPLVVLDLANNAHAVAALRDTLPAADSDRDAQDWLVAQIADAIEAQTGAPRIPEPGLWGVVEAGVKQHDQRLRWVKLGDDHYRPNDSREYDRTWADLIDPILIREGLS